MKKIKLLLIVGLLFVIPGCGGLVKEFGSQLNGAVQNEISNNTTKIVGTARLHNQTNHSGISVGIAKQVESMYVNSVVSDNFKTVATTSSSGGFYFDVTKPNGEINANELQMCEIQTNGLKLQTGMYKIKFEKSGYDSVVIDNVPVIFGQSVYNLDFVELKEKIEYIEVHPGLNVELLILNNNVDKYKIDLYDTNIKNIDKIKFDLVYWNLKKQYGLFFVENATWNSIKNAIISNHEGCSIRLYIHNDKNLEIPTIKIKIIKI